ncbi:MAG: hypothetical protein LBG83_03125 [Oscillospiraceae bacterium]|jgi:hypothetical protein|nr:hypothetical protein [Oscillospiraceae bacterium]
MLGKLLKNEFIHTGRMIVWLLGGGILAGGIGALVTLNQNIQAGQFLVAMLWNFLLILGAMLIEVLALVIILVGTNRSLFTERGYLTFALPVSTMEMLFTKFFTNVVLLGAAYIETGALMFVAFSNFRRLIRNASETIAAQAGDMGGMAEMGGLGNALGLASFQDIVTFAAYLLGVMLVFLILAMMVVLFVFTITHVRPFQAKPGLWMPIFFIAVAVVCQQIVTRVSDLADIPIKLNLMNGALGEEGISINLVMAIVMLALSAALFFLTNWLLKRKISLK